MTESGHFDGLDGDQKQRAEQDVHNIFSRLPSDTESIRTTEAQLAEPLTTPDRRRGGVTAQRLARGTGQRRTPQREKRSPRVLDSPPTAFESPVTSHPIPPKRVRGRPDSAPRELPQLEPKTPHQPPPPR